ncbi:hypothetical protein BGX28_005705 [Mortierella sp. GBA30]|nr:hypothetical protein BGX28_005705 [Mortierella sp. GBA30]
MEKSLPALPLSEEQVQGIQGRSQDPGSNSSGLQNGQQATGSQFLAPLQLDGQQSFSDELGSYLSEQEAFQPPPPLKEALLNNNTSQPSPSLPIKPTTTQTSEADSPAFATISASISPSQPFSTPVATATYGSTAGSLNHQASVTYSVISNSSSTSTVSTTSSNGYPLPSISSEGAASAGPEGQSAQPLSSQNAYHPQQQQLYYQQQQKLQQQAYASRPGAYVPQTTYVPQTQYSSQPSQPSQPSQLQSQLPYQPQQQQLPSHTRTASYPIPPPAAAGVNGQPSPSALVPSLGISSSIPQSNNSIAPSPSFPPVSGGGGVVRAPSPLGFTTGENGGSGPIPTPSVGSSSSDESRDQGHQQHFRMVSQGHTRVASGRVSPLFLNSNNSNSSNSNTEYLKPVPAKSEDWAALVDAPLSPTIPYANSGMRQGPFMSMQAGYTDSPAEEVILSGDYMQHMSQQQPPRQSINGSRPFAQTDPTSLRHRHLYQHHQQHNSMSSMTSFSGNTGPGDNHVNNSMVVPNERQQNRKSWSPNQFEPLEGTPSGQQSSYGFHTPPRRHNASPIPRSGGGHSKQNSVATSVSLLNDTAIVAKYREAAIKTNDTSLQLSYAKYLLEIGEPSPTPGTLEPSPPPPSSSTTMVAGSETLGRPSTSSSGSGTTTPGPQDGSETGKRQLTQEAIYWIDRLAKEGQPEAQFIRGTWYEDGLYGTKKSQDKAVRWYQSASKGDYAPAHYKVAYYCEKRKDNNKAVVLYKKAATQNDVPSNHRLAMVYLYGELGQTKNMKTGLQYLKRAAANATVTCPMAPYVLALILAREYKQLDIPDDIAFPDDGEALEWFRKSAELGYGPANYKLGYCHEYGTLGSPIDPFLSIQHYERAVLAGDSNGEAEMALSGWYLSGAENCFEADDALAFQYAAKAAEKQLPKAQYAMGYYHEVGISIPIDMTKAMEFYRLAATNGNKDAQVRLSNESTFDKSGHKNSIRRIKQGRHAKDQSCSVM